jgi:hypothetical protein
LATLKVEAVKVPPQPETRAPLKLAKIKPVTKCYECSGKFVHGLWVHSTGCRRTVLLYYQHGYKASDWTRDGLRVCPFKCAGQAMSFSVTHHYACEFWGTTLATPFDEPDRALEVDDEGT